VRVSSCMVVVMNHIPWDKLEFNRLSLSCWFDWLVCVRLPPFNCGFCGGGAVVTTNGGCEAWVVRS